MSYSIWTDYYSVNDLACLNCTFSLPFVDTESIYTECTQSILDRYGKKYTKESKIRAMGRPRLEAAQVVVDDAGIPLTAEEFSKELYALLFQRFPTAKYMPGIIGNVINWLARLNFALFRCTSNPAAPPCSWGPAGSSHQFSYGRIREQDQQKTGTHFLFPSHRLRRQPRGQKG